ncbi:MAG: OmpA family protein [Bacteroidota bacterium]
MASSQPAAPLPPQRPAASSPADGDGAATEQPPGHTQARPLAPSTEAPPPNGEEIDATFETLRQVLVGPERDALDRLQVRFEALQTQYDDVQARITRVGQVLPEAILFHRDQDATLIEALRPTVESSIRHSITRDPKPLADALFPIMGPAIRRAIQRALRDLVATMNRALEYSFTLRGLRWRVEAYRTGVPLAEVILRHTLRYRVEQVFLIHRSTGLLLAHVTADHIESMDPDLVSGMLTAIQSFVHDSFGADDEDHLESLRMGDLTVRAAQGPEAVLAAVVRGVPPPELQRVLETALEEVHEQLGSVLSAFDGQTEPFELTRPLLEGCLQAQYAELPKRHGTLATLAVLAGLALLVIVALQVRGHLRWQAAVEALHAQPGIVVTETQRRGQAIIEGLRDPLSVDPAAVLEAHGLAPDEVTLAWQPYQSLEPSLSLARAYYTLQPPPGVSLTLEGTTLRATGTAPASWVDVSQQMARVLPGIRAFDARALTVGAPPPVEP